MIIIILLIPTILCYLTLKLPALYKSLLSIFFYILCFVITELFKNIISNLHYNLTDQIGYNNITNFTRFFAGISDIFFIIIITLILFILYKKLKP